VVYAAVYFLFLLSLFFFLFKFFVQLVARLTDRRIAVQRELTALGESKRGSQDIFKHCRGFERAFQVMLNEANVAFKIRAVVEGHLPEILRRIPIEKRFNKNYTKEVRRFEKIVLRGFEVDKCCCCCPIISPRN